MFQPIISNFDFLTPTHPPRQIWLDTNSDQKLSKLWFFDFFLFLTKSVPTRTKSHPHSKLFDPKCIVADCRLVCGHLHRVATCQGKVREKQDFLQVRELSGNFEKVSGKFGFLTNVRELSGNFLMTIVCLFFEVLNFCWPCFTQHSFPLYLFQKLN